MKVAAQAPTTDAFARGQIRDHGTRRRPPAIPSGSDQRRERKIGKSRRPWPIQVIGEASRAAARAVRLTLRADGREPRTQSAAARHTATVPAALRPGAPRCATRPGRLSFTGS